MTYPVLKALGFNSLNVHPFQAVGFKYQTAPPYIAVAMLNALGAQGLATPVDGMYDPYPYYTQRALFENECVAKAGHRPRKLDLELKAPRFQPLKVKYNETAFKPSVAISTLRHYAEVPTHREGESMSAKFLASHGATLHEWQQYLKCFADVEHAHASGATADDFRNDLLGAFSSAPGAALRYVVRGGGGEGNAVRKGGC